MTAAAEAGSLEQSIAALEASARSLAAEQSQTSFGVFSSRISEAATGWQQALDTLAASAAQAADSFTDFARVRTACGTTVVSYTGRFQTAWKIGVSEEDATGHARSLTDILAQRRALLTRLVAVAQLLATLVASGANPLAALSALRQLQGLLGKASAS